jgi:chromosomal replication initiation ATPase DnaA
MDQLETIAAQLPPIKQRGLSIDAALGVIAARHGVTPASILQRTRRRSVVRPRQEFTWVARKAGASLLDIAAYLGQDHTTIMHSIRTIDRLIQEEASENNDLPQSQITATRG